MDKTVVDYISRNLKKGVPLSKIKTALSKAGHTVDEIETASKQVLYAEPHLSERYAKIKYVYLVAGIVAIIIVGYLALTFIPSISVPEAAEPARIVKPALQPKSAQENLALLKLAKSEGDTQVCSEITNHHLKYVCEDKYWERNDCSYEDAIGEGAILCYYDRAMNEKNSTICHRTDKYATCIEKLAEQEADPTYCDGNMVCQQNYALATNDPKGCEAIDQIADIDAREECYTTISVNTGNRALCKGATSRCEYYFLTEPKEKLAYGQKVYDSAEVGFSESEPLFTLKEEALGTFIYDVGDALLCDLSDTSKVIHGDNLRTICIWYVANIHQDIDACDYLSGGTEKHLCERLVEEPCTEESVFDCDTTTRIEQLRSS